jgi:hypothetical protein
VFIRLYKLVSHPIVKALPPAALLTARCQQGTSTVRTLRRTDRRAANGADMPDHPPTAPCIEIAEFALQPDTTEAELREALAGLDAFLTTQPGFIRRRTLRDGTQCADLVEWHDRASADAGAQAVMQSPAAARYFALLDLAAVRMRHFEVIA